MSEESTDQPPSARSLVFGALLLVAALALYVAWSELGEPDPDQMLNALQDGLGAAFGGP